MLVRSFGYNGKGALGLGVLSQAKLSPQPAPAFGDARWVQTLSFSSMVVDAAGRSRACGGGLMGQRCDGQKTQSQTEVWETLLPPVRMIAGTGAKGIGVLRDGRVVTWGADGWGQLGSGYLPAIPGNEDELASSAVPVFPVPVVVQFGLEVAQVAAGYNHSGVVFADGTTAGVGSNLSGQVGDGTTTTTGVFVRTLATGVRASACGWGFKLYLKDDGTVWFVGHNSRGSCPGQPAGKVLVPVRIEGLSNVVAIAAAGTRCAALTATGDVVVWGEDAPGLTTVLDGCSAVSVGCYDQAGKASLLMVREAAMWAMGRNDYGQLGVGDRLDRPVPVPTGLTGVVGVSAGEVHGLALAA